MKPALLLALLLPVAASCSEPELAPASGTWDFVEGLVVDNACGDMLGISSGRFTLTNNDDGTCTVDPQDSDVSFDCELDGEAFECPERVQTTIAAEAAMATIEIALRESGTFSSNTTASGRRDGTASCEGEGCSVVGALLGASFPCTAAIEFTATFKE